MPPMLAPSELEIARELPSAECSTAEAERYTRRLATSHYENFNVVSWLLPKRLHQHFYNLYAYCRWADDLGDEIPDTHRALDLLAWWEEELKLCYAGRPSHPVFVALAGTIRAFDIPMAPFADLLTAFRQDQVIQRYATWEEVINYCRYSANPVGRLVLYLCGHRDRRAAATFGRDLHSAAAREFLAGCFARSGKGADIYSAGCVARARIEF